ncbi:hypothetical protein DPSP01_013950 [Paraphaeosphaeria sporulosa]|uniref:Uncharacterized protein n=1 Tax=Paraphaeosphaeria sporulosa TaxID=1460663 RepID=A0A177CTQ2_9PLEO|nr:uncharacterized protein CC84DRAFT_1161256 [Paraphaeosphaeria sporulosa]OAG10292.1 hypothetical protein CC84DRAFT_1161256 [Paraphaeosphaeria sporulosa]
MHARFQPFAQAFKAPRQWTQYSQARQQPRLAASICQSCHRNFSLRSPLSALRKITQASRRRVSTAAQNVKDKKYAEQIVVYEAGSNRTAFIGTWKAIALFQFGVCTVWLAPHLYLNQNQPDKSVRVFQTVGVMALATIPSIILSFITAPFVTSIKLWPIPPHARHSLTALRSFAANLPATTKLTFQTLRIFPMPKHTTIYAHELRALPPRKFRFANIELPKSAAWAQRQREKSLFKRAWEFVEERRFKFYVKEGVAYTMKTGVPGVWEEVARGIKARTETKGDRKEGGGDRTRRIASKKAVPAKKDVGVQMPAIRRQTSRRV